jgi:hypothetical protein
VIWEGVGVDEPRHLRGDERDGEGRGHDREHPAMAPREQRDGERPSRDEVGRRDDQVQHGVARYGGVPDGERDGGDDDEPEAEDGDQ